MTKSTSKITIAGCLTLGAVQLMMPLAQGTAYAADYPSRPIRMIVPYPPGGAGDLTARPLAQAMGIALKQAIVVENRVGASAVIGTQLAARAEPDGYTVALVDSAAIVINPAVYKDLPYKPSDFYPVSLVVTSPFVLVVNPSLHISTVKELIDVGKKQNLDYGSAGNGSLSQLTMEWFKTATGTHFVHIPYKGAQSFTAVVSGEVKVLAGSMLGLSPFIRSHQVVAIAVTSAKRSALMPDLPTIAESGVPGFDASNWYGLVVPKDTPKSIVDKLNETIVQVVRTPNIKQHYGDVGAEAVGTTPQAFAQVIQADLKKWAKVAKESNAHID